MSSEAYISEIMLFAGSYAPRGQVVCDGSLMPIQQNQALYSLLGNAFGGSMSSMTFGLPDLRGVIPTGSNQDAQSGIAEGSDVPAVSVQMLMCTTGVYPPRQ